MRHILFLLFAVVLCCACKSRPSGDAVEAVDEFKITDVACANLYGPVEAVSYTEGYGDASGDENRAGIYMNKIMRFDRDGRQLDEMMYHDGSYTTRTYLDDSTFIGRVNMGDYTDTIRYIFRPGVRVASNSVWDAGEAENAYDRKWFFDNRGRLIKEKGSEDNTDYSYPNDTTMLPDRVVSRLVDFEDRNYVTDDKITYTEIDSYGNWTSCTVERTVRDEYVYEFNSDGSPVFNEPPVCTKTFTVKRTIKYHD